MQGLLAIRHSPKLPSTPKKPNGKLKTQRPGYCATVGFCEPMGRLSRIGSHANPLGRRKVQTHPIFEHAMTRGKRAGDSI